MALLPSVRLDPFPQPPLIQTRHPLVLMHGFGALAAVRRGGQLHGTALALRQHGVLAYAPNVAPYNPVAVRAAQWEVHLNRILDETKADRLNLVAHSMGGLDARYLIRERGLHDRIATLTTISTPHHGTPLCAFLAARPERLRGWIERLLNGLGAASMAEVEADARQALAEMLPAYTCETFNPSVPDHPSVRYYSFAGRAGKGTDVTINPFLLLPNRIVYRAEGENDGYVSVESARWGTFLGTIDADHTLQIGLRVPPAPAFDTAGFYAGIARRLADEGF